MVGLQGVEVESNDLSDGSVKLILPAQLTAAVHRGINWCWGDVEPLRQGAEGIS